MYLLRSLGTPAVLDPSGEDMGLPLGKPLALLVYLALAPAPVSREDIAALLWPTATRARGLQSVRQAIWLIRRTLGEDVLLGGDPVSVDRRLLEADLHRVERLLQRGKEDEVAPLLHGDFLEGLSLPNLPEWDAWARHEVEAWRERVASELLRRGAAHRSAGRLDKAEGLLGSARVVQPLVADAEVAEAVDTGLVGVVEPELEPWTPPPPAVVPDVHRPPLPPAGVAAGWDQRGPSWRRVWAPLASVAILLVVLVAGFSLFQPAGPPLHGGGELWVRSPGGDLVVTPGSLPDEEWSAVRPEGFIPGEDAAMGPFPAPGGDPRWFASRRTEDGAHTVVELLPDGEEDVRVRGGGSGVLGDLHPDGRTILHIRPDPSVAGGPAVLTLDPGTGGPSRTVLRSSTPILLARWSPGGEQLVAATRGVPDSLLVLTGAGERVDGVSWPTIWSACWTSSGRIAFVGEQDGEPRVMQWDLSTRSVDPLRNPGPLAAPHLACSPDGSAVVVLTMQDGLPGLELVPLDGTPSRPLSIALGDIPASLRWVPTGVRPLITGITVEAVPGPLRWGEQYPLQASVTWSDGVSRETPVDWQATDPDIVSVGPDGVITTNRPGSAHIVARAGGWRSDTLLVEVEPRQVTEGVVIRESFAALDSTRWQSLGEPAPRVVQMTGGPALELSGDGERQDGLILGDPISLPRGGTVELEFLTEFTRTDGQHIRLVLGSAEPRPGGDPSRWSGWQWDRQLVVTYPEAGPGGRFNPDRISIEGTGWRFLDIPEEVQQGEWTHLAVQVRADGEVSFYMNHRYLGTAPGRLPVVPGEKWRVALLGAAVDTRLFVRNLVVWGEPRYQAPRLIGQPPGVRAMAPIPSLTRPG